MSIPNPAIAHLLTLSRTASTPDELAAAWTEITDCTDGSAPRLAPRDVLMLASALISERIAGCPVASDADLGAAVIRMSDGIGIDVGCEWPEVVHCACGETHGLRPYAEAHMGGYACEACTAADNAEEESTDDIRAQVEGMWPRGYTCEDIAEMSREELIAVRRGIQRAIAFGVEVF